MTEQEIKDAKERIKELNHRIWHLEGLCEADVCEICASVCADAQWEIDHLNMDLAECGVDIGDEEEMGNV